jgi:hypothetical protein
MNVAKVDQGRSICCKCFRDMLRAFVQNVSYVPYVCCKRFDLDVTYVSHICCNNMFFQMFHMFQSYVAASVFMLQVASVLSRCCIYFTYMLQMYVLHISSVSNVCCIQVFHVVRRVRGAESDGGTTRCREWGRGEPRANGRGARCIGGWRSGRDRTRCACGSGRTARRMGASRIEVNGVDYMYEASRSDGQAQRCC